jgi:Domain of unknown function (DUF222)
MLVPRIGALDHRGNDAYTNPRRPGQDPDRDRAEGVSGMGADGERTPHSRRLMNAFGFLLEHLDPTRLPFHGGDATRVMVTINLDTILKGLGIAVTDTGTTITADQARRLACTAGIIPAVPNGKSEVLDLGRTRRLYSASQQRAFPHLNRPRCSVTVVSIHPPGFVPHPGGHSTTERGCAAAGDRSGGA